ncbi:MAG: TonB family protein [Luteimonas sp.]|nr:TonB family protein [Luteimonas sp.]
MVLQHARSYPQSSRPHPNPNPTRIVGMAGAVALNVALLMLLLVPMAAPPPEAVKEPPPWVIPIDKPPPLPPPPIQRVDIVRPSNPTPQATVKPDIQPVTPVPALVEEGTLPVESIVQEAVDTSQTEVAAPTTPIAGVRLEYAHAPSPPYPVDAIRGGLQGVVMLQILVDTDGRPLEVSIHKSSGHRKLDEAARRFVLKHWTFTPAMKDGRAVQAIGIVPIDFNLGRQ